MEGSGGRSLDLEAYPRPTCRIERSISNLTQFLSGYGSFLFQRRSDDAACKYCEDHQKENERGVE
ncbi:hypothetical protein J6590_045295 [Homalodisca vitripennis]|nr:hypothetical protein J6590_045295 [Homalodisca vitripennis]